MARACGQSDKRVDEVLDLVGLHDDAHRKVSDFSLGMRQRLELAGALLGDPSVLILDEPSNGLDPQGIAWLRDFMRYLAGEGKTVLVSSHLLSEMAQTIDEVVILSHGVLRAQGTLESITANLTASNMRVRSPEIDRLTPVLDQVAHDLHPHRARRVDRASSHARTARPVVGPAPDCAARPLA